MVQAVYTVKKNLKKKTMGFKCLGKFLWKKERHVEEPLTRLMCMPKGFKISVCKFPFSLHNNKII